MTLPISVFIIAKNEEARLPKCLKALKSWAGEIVLVDSGSSDGTLRIAESHGAKIATRRWTGYGPQKRYAEQLCRHDWVLNVDADEVITPELAAEIAALFARGEPAPGAYRMPILTVYPGCTKPRLWANDYNVVRLYHRSVATYSESPVHDRVLTGALRPKQLRAPAYHFTHISIAHAARKAVTFSEFRAGQSTVRSPAFLKMRLLIEFPMVFLKTYFGRRHFTGGWRGYYFALSHAFMRATRLALMLERR